MARVSQHYPILDKISAQTVDHANLFAVAAGIYAPRVIAYKMRMAQERADARTRQHVVQIRPAQ